MPPPAYANLNQRCIVWPVGDVDRYNEPSFGPPVQVNCRWENVQRDMNAPDGRKITVDATVVTYQEFDVGSLMWEGGFNDAPGTGSGTGTSFRVEDGYMQIAAYEKMKDLRGQVTSRRYGLVFFRQSEITVNDS